ncbi:hypothetical protein Arub01_11330 [Actinomadura rubrobrunea]|uniref:Phosphoribosyltransferase n=1 Tax=Actinomadura rubrobrunea TaxID=115335 RepID=A0A9W6PTP0_9ACTN|nr:phosphoribosyltransferase family protein [Actinomadura rubrobrunea]GLW62889.1 hypothetical protein Arub01_11330 [Actinomadura rubrobrunea]
MSAGRAAPGRIWPGEWVAARLGVRLVDGERPAGVGLADLAGLAVRRNPRRAHLLVSTVLGKHVPTDPRLVYGAGLLLGRLVRARLKQEPLDDPLLAGALAQNDGAAVALRDAHKGPHAPIQAVVFGYAETATALGHAVADALGGAYYLHSTRRPVRGFVPYGAFEEEHSHATSHLILPADPDAFDRDVPVVLVDDELSTGRTALNTIRALHAARPRRHYIVAALTDLRDDTARAQTQSVAAALGARIDAVALATGRVELPPGILPAGQRLVASLSSGADPARDGHAARHAVERVDVGWPDGLPEGGRHGFRPEDGRRLGEELPAMADRLARALPAGRRRVLVLGFEELMYAPLRLAEALADARPDLEVRYSTTTRSPVLAVDDPGYAVRTRLVFPAHDDPPDGPGERYAYNVARGFDLIVLVVDDVGDTPALAAGLLRRLAGVADVLLVTVPAHRRQSR